MFIHSSIDGHTGYFHLSAIVDNAATDVGVQVSVHDTAFSFYWSC